jgi:hypothetical protein
MEAAAKSLSVMVFVLDIEPPPDGSGPQLTRLAVRERRRGNALHAVALEED